MNTDKLLNLARHSLGCYAIANYPQFELAPHLKIVASRLQALATGKLRRLIVCLPPRHGKSVLGTVMLPSWFLGRFPDKQVISASYGQELADDFGRQVRNFIASSRHQAIFPECRLSDDAAAAHRFATTRGGAYFAVGRGAATTGRGAHLLIIDDSMKDRIEANSASIRRSVQEWYAQVAFTRLMPGGVIVIIGNRWHEEDLVGWILESHAEEWDVVSFPAIAERDETFRREGEALWPAHYPLEELGKIRRQLGGAAWACLYQQRPAAAEGAIFKRRWWRFFRELDSVRSVVQSWDTAFKTGSENDFSACTTWGIGKDGLYLLQSWRGRVEFPELKRKVTEFYREQNPRPMAVLIEDRASGQSLIQALERESFLPIVRVRVDSDKIARAQAVTPLIEGGKVFLPDGPSWRDREVFIDELATFPAAAHDDYVDSAVQALNYLCEQQASRGDLEVMKACLGPVRQPWDDPYVRAEMVELPEFFNRRR